MLYRFILFLTILSSPIWAQRETTFFDLDEALKHKDEAFRLDLSYQNLSSFPDKIFELKNLKRLNLSHNQITSIPEKIKELPDLRRIILSYNKIEQIPVELTTLSELKKLYLDHNKLLFIPTEIKFLDELKRLEVQGNPLLNLPKEIKFLSKLEILKCDQSVLINPKSELDSLTHLGLKNWSFINHVPDSINGKSLAYYLALQQISHFNKKLIQGIYPIQHENPDLSFVNGLANHNSDEFHFYAYIYKHLYLPWMIGNTVRSRVNSIILDAFFKHPEHYIKLHNEYVRSYDRIPTTSTYLHQNYLKLFPSKEKWIHFYNWHVAKEQELAIVRCRFDSIPKGYYYSYDVYFFDDNNTFLSRDYISSSHEASHTAAKNLKVKYYLVKSDMMDRLFKTTSDDRLIQKTIIDSAIFSGVSVRSKIEDTAVNIIPSSCIPKEDRKKFDLPKPIYEGYYDQENSYSSHNYKDSCERVHRYTNKEKYDLFLQYVYVPSEKKQLSQQNMLFLKDLKNYLSDTARNNYIPLGAPIYPVFKLNYQDGGCFASLMLLDHYANWSEEDGDSTKHKLYTSFLRRNYTIISTDSQRRKISKINRFNDYRDACFEHDCFQLYEMEDDDSISPVFAFHHDVSLSYDFPGKTLNKQLYNTFNCLHNTFYCDRGSSPVVHSLLKGTDNLFFTYSTGYYPGRSIYLRLENGELVELWHFNIENVECSCI